MSNLNEALDGAKRNLEELTATFTRMDQTLQEFTLGGQPRHRSFWTRATPYILVASSILLCLGCILMVLFGVTG